MECGKNQTHSAISAPIVLKFCTNLEGDNTQNRVGENFEIPPLKKFGTPLNFAFALRRMVQQISNPLYSSFQNCFGLTFSHALARGRESLL